MVAQEDVPRECAVYSVLLASVLEGKVTEVFDRVPCMVLKGWLHLRLPQKPALFVTTLCSW